MAYTIATMKKFFSTPEKPVSMSEMKEFKDSCTPEQWEEYKNTPMND